MTTLNSAVSLRFGKTILSAVCAGLLAAALSGCESASNILSSNNADKPGPQTALTAPPPAASPSAPQAQLAKVEVAPPIGGPETVTRDLQSQLAAAFDRNKIASTTAAGKAEYTVRGYIVASREKTGSKISYIWDVTDKADKRVHRVTGEEFAAGAGKDPWSAVTPDVIQTIASKTSADIASFLQQGASSVPVANASQAVAPTSSAPSQAVAAANSAKPVAATPAALASAAAPASGPTTGSIDPTGPVQTIVPAVIGAPGDGGASLTSAIQRELSKGGVSLASVPGTQTYRVEGRVALGQGKDGKQPIQIDWDVVDPKGKKLGTVSQKNDVPQGSLDGTWGKTADAAAAAAAQGILKLLPQQKATTASN